jgi:hypothetical protein
MLFRTGDILKHNIENKYIVICEKFFSEDKFCYIIHEILNYSEKITYAKIIKHLKRITEEIKTTIIDRDIIENDYTLIKRMFYTTEEVLDKNLFPELCDFYTKSSIENQCDANEDGIYEYIYIDSYLLLNPINRYSIVQNNFDNKYKLCTNSYFVLLKKEKIKHNFNDILDKINKHKQNNGEITKEFLENFETEDETKTFADTLTLYDIKKQFTIKYEVGNDNYYIV